VIYTFLSPQHLFQRQMHSAPALFVLLTPLDINSPFSWDFRSENSLPQIW